MQITYRIDTKLNTIFTNVEGLITIEDLIEHTKRIQSDPELKKNMNSMVDLTKVKPAKGIDLGKVNLYKEFIESIQKTIGKCKWAVIAPQDIIFGLSRIYEMLSVPLSIQTKIFRTEKEARDWLGI